jgi:hypothetical protein
MVFRTERCFVLLALSCTLLMWLVQVHPAEVKAGILALDTAFTYDAQVAAFCSIECMIGRRGPAMVSMKWSDVAFVKQAVKLPDGSMVHAFGCVLRFRAEKALDIHNSTKILLDVSGDQAILEEMLLFPSMQLLNLALGLGVVDAASVVSCPVGETLPMVAAAEDW